MKNLIYYLIIALTILLLPDLVAQDITGDWYGLLQTTGDSMHLTLHIYKDSERLKATMDSPDENAFGILIDEIKFKKDTLIFRIFSRDIAYKGSVSKDFQIISGDLSQFGSKRGLEFGRKKLKRILPVNFNALPVKPAAVRVVEIARPQSIPYNGIRVVETGNPKTIEIDTSKLKVLTPGKDTVSNPVIYKLPEPVTKDKYLLKAYYREWAPVIVKAKQPEPVHAQPMRLKDAACFNVQYLDIEQGLNDPNIMCILEDSKGNLWFGSYNSGIFKYDGKSITNYTITEGLTDNWIHTMIEDRGGNIWIGTDNGLCKYDGNYFTQYSGLLFGRVLSLLESRNGNIWVGTYQGGIFEKTGNLWTYYAKNEGFMGFYNPVSSIAEDNSGNLWFGTQAWGGDVCKFDGVSVTHFTENEGLINNIVTSIVEDKYGNLWFGTDRGVNKYNGKTFRQFTINESLALNAVNSVLEDNSGSLWFGTRGGVIIYDGNIFTQYTIREGLSNNNIQAIKEDKSKNIWLATSGNGVMKIQKNSFTYINQFEDLAKGEITSIIEDHNGNIWFTKLESLIKFNGEKFQLITDKKYQSFNDVQSIIEDRNGNIWFTRNLNPENLIPDLRKYDDKTVTIYNNKVIWQGTGSHCLIEDKKGKIWVGTLGEGVKIFDGVSFSDLIHSKDFEAYNITSILEDKNENIWLGSSDQGLLKYHRDCITKYDINDGLFSLQISCLFEDEIGNLWIGTLDRGIIKFDGESFIYFTDKEGLSSNTVRSVIGDRKGNIWVGTKRGLSLLSPREGGNYFITSFSAEDGLKNLSFNNQSVCLDKKNRIWWGTGEIVTMLDLNTYEVNQEPPKIQLNSININQKYIDFRALLHGTKEAEESPAGMIATLKLRGLKYSAVTPFYNYPVDLVLPHYLNNVTFNFSAIDWTAPQSIRYQYMVEGMDKEWNPLIKENKADYRNIPSGKYIFKVKAISKTGVWSETFEYPFIVHPPWWLSWWAYTFYALVLILIARFYIRYRIGRERIKAEIHIKQLEVDKMMELDQMKSRFFANISHEFRTPLTLIIGPIEDLVKRKPERAELTWDIVGIIHRNARRLQKLINQILDLSVLETGKLKLQVSEGNFEEFLRAIILSFLSLAESKKIRYEYKLPETVRNTYFDRDKVEKISTNLISNALKFTPEGGYVMVTLQYLWYKNVGSGKKVASGKNILSGLYAELEVKDTGPGIPEDEREKVFYRFYQVNSSDSRDHEGSGIGLALVKEMVELYRGEIHVESETGKGSAFKVTLPVSREQFREDEIITFSDKPVETKIMDGHEVMLKEFAGSATRKKTFKEKDKALPIVLIVEDNEDLRKYISGNLSDHYQILEAENGKEGLDEAIENIPDLVISDHMMPEMNGLEMCDRLKKDTRTNNIPLIMLTAKADRESKLESLETGADDYIIKPFDTEELKVRVRNLIDQRRKLREHYRKEFLTYPADHEIPLHEDEFLSKFMDCTKKHLGDPAFSVDQLGKELHLSRVQLYRKVLSLTDHTPGEFIRNIRLRTAARMFLEGHRNITSVLYSVGYNTPSHFTQSFRKLFGINPSEYINKHSKTSE